MVGCAGCHCHAWGGAAGGLVGGLIGARSASALASRKGLLNMVFAGMIMMVAGYMLWRSLGAAMMG